MTLLKHWLRPMFHFLRSYAYALAYGFPARKLRIIAITGTDGKTTTANMIVHMMQHQGLKVALASTVWFSLPSKGFYRNRTKMTSLPPKAMQQFLKQCLKERVDYVVLEASSVALHQYRVAGMRPFIACLTNITREEMVYHRTMEHYEDSKRMIMRGAKYGVLPKNFSHWDDGKVEIRYWDRSCVPQGTLQIAGDYNYENAAVAFEVGQILGLAKMDILESLSTFKGVVGRMQKVSDRYGRHIYVDYAVTPAAFEAIYVSLRKAHPKSRIIHVFGATGGGRDKAKRPLLGNVAGRYCDQIILTDEESYGESVPLILDQIVSGIGETSKAVVQRIEDRSQALQKALEIACEGDVIVSTGMGGEMTRNVAGSGTSDSDTTGKLGGQDIEWEEEHLMEQWAKSIPAKR